MSYCSFIATKTKREVEHSQNINEHSMFIFPCKRRFITEHKKVSPARTIEVDYDSPPPTDLIGSPASTFIKSELGNSAINMSITKSR